MMANIEGLGINARAWNNPGLLKLNHSLLKKQIPIVLVLENHDRLTQPHKNLIALRTMS
jgi:hypothetical protein